MSTSVLTLIVVVTGVEVLTLTCVRVMMTCDVLILDCWAWLRKRRTSVHTVVEARVGQTLLTIVLVFVVCTSLISCNSGNKPRHAYRDCCWRGLSDCRSLGALYSRGLERICPVPVVSDVALNILWRGCRSPESVLQLTHLEISSVSCVTGLAAARSTTDRSWSSRNRTARWGEAGRC